MNTNRKSYSNKLKGKKSKWSTEADFRIRNRKWLRYSSNIARRVLASIEGTENLSQRVLADKVGVSIQYINKVLKGQQNLTLETIAKLSDAVGQELISFPPYKYSQPIHDSSSAMPQIYRETSFSTMGIILGVAVTHGQTEFSINSNEAMNMHLWRTLAASPVTGYLIGNDKNPPNITVNDITRPA